jgi:hypothetical protein
MWPLWAIILKSASEGAQTLLNCAMSPIDYSKRGESGWLTVGYYRDCREAKYVFVLKETYFRYHREEILSIEECEDLRKRTDEEIATAEKKSAIRRKVEKAQAEAKAK